MVNALFRPRVPPGPAAQLNRRLPIPIGVQLR